MKVAFTIPTENLETAAARISAIVDANASNPTMAASMKADIKEALTVAKRAETIELPEAFFSRIKTDPQPFYDAIAWSIINDFRKELTKT